MAVLAESTSAQPKAVKVLKIKAVEGANGKYSFDSVPDTFKAGNLTVEFSNPGKFEHDVTILRIDGFHTTAQIMKVIESEGAPIPSWLHAAGGVGRTRPGGGVSRATMNLGPGQYLFLSTVIDEKTKKSDAASGMAKFVTVTGGKAKALPGGATASIVAKEYGFEVKGLKAGTNMVMFSSPGKELHHFLMFPILPGKTIQQVLAAFSATEPTGPPPVDFENGQTSAVIENSEGPILTEVTLSAGRYVVICFMTDRVGGPPHVAKGMISEVVVK